MEKSLRDQAAELLALALDDPAPGARFWMMDAALALHRLANERGEPFDRPCDDPDPGSGAKRGPSEGPAREAAHPR